MWGPSFAVFSPTNAHLLLRQVCCQMGSLAQVSCRSWKYFLYSKGCWLQWAIELGASVGESDWTGRRHSCRPLKESKTRPLEALLLAGDTALHHLDHVARQTQFLSHWFTVGTGRGAENTYFIISSTFNSFSIIPNNRKI